jgi:hypothetical protein
VAAEYPIWTVCMMIGPEPTSGVAAWYINDVNR